MGEKESREKKEAVLEYEIKERAYRSEKKSNSTIGSADKGREQKNRSTNTKNGNRKGEFFS